ncbi:MAG: hypothetical protein AB1469_02700 [Pseudomonadota bacterium]
MVGKKNVVFGFLFLVFTAALGPYMVLQLGTVQKAEQDKQTALSRLEQLSANNFEENLEPLSADQIAKANTGALLTIGQLLNAQGVINAIKSGPHTHGNLESLLNIVVGIVLGMLTIPALFKQIISWAFIAGTVLHSGMLYFAVMFNQGWAWKILGTGIGPILILLGLLLAGVASYMGLRPVRGEG